jgi:hypothetical protein
VGQRAFTLQRLNLGVEQFVIHGDLAHLGFLPGDLVVAVIAFAFFQGCSRACQRTLALLGQPGNRDIRHPHFETGLEKTVKWFLQNRSWWQRILDCRYQAHRVGMINAGS